MVTPVGRLIAGALAVVGGAVAGWTTDSDGPLAGAMQMTTSRVGTRAASTPSDDAGATTCHDAIAERLAEIDELRRAAYGEPIPFPPDLEPHLLPEAVEERAQRVMTECPELGWTLHEVDCSEYPCITFWDAPGDRWDAPGDGPDDRSSPERIDECPAWGDRPGQGKALKVSCCHTDPGGASRQLVVLAEFSRHADDTWNIAPPGGRLSRFDLRTQPAFSELEERLRAARDQAILAR